ncbi:MAG: tyrosine-protein phosphatase [Planctomycetota bacterium]|nr:tyrosine-protein phosphatase [Planctomycetota bacterium]
MLQTAIFRRYFSIVLARRDVVFESSERESDVRDASEQVRRERKWSVMKLEAAGNGGIDDGAKSNPISKGGMKRSHLKWIVAGAVLAVATGGAIKWYSSAVWKFRFGIVEEGVLYRSAQPSVAQLERVASRYGIRTVVNLRKPGPEDGGNFPEEAAAAKALGIEFVNIPYTNECAQQHIASFLEVMADPSRRPVLVHCSAGKERTGVMVAAYRISRHGWTLERALAEMQDYGFDPADGRRFVEAVREFARALAAGGKTGRESGERAGGGAGEAGSR